jgi:hypothetical protein
MSEAEFQAAVCRLCRKYGLVYFHSTDSRQDIGPGFPDLVIVGLHDSVFAELKTEYSGLDREQTIWMYRLRAAGQRHYVWRPSDLTSGTIEETLSTL